MGSSCGCRSNLKARKSALPILSAASCHSCLPMRRQRSAAPHSASTASDASKAWRYATRKPRITKAAVAATCHVTQGRVLSACSWRICRRWRARRCSTRRPSCCSRSCARACTARAECREAAFSAPAIKGPSGALRPWAAWGPGEPRRSCPVPASRTRAALTIHSPEPGSMAMKLRSTARSSGPESWGFSRYHSSLTPTRSSPDAKLWTAATSCTLAMCSLRSSASKARCLAPLRTARRGPRRAADAPEAMLLPCCGASLPCAAPLRVVSCTRPAGLPRTRSGGPWHELGSRRRGIPWALLAL
mmetsp:Transcript_87487/g.283257  ORF Transcript_87487/g.283257 Transcript_87487/m.283257 type:complete len:303 (-) Transcript_87487:219-1127(-)